MSQETTKEHKPAGEGRDNRDNRDSRPPREGGYNRGPGGGGGRPFNRNFKPGGNRGGFRPRKKRKKISKLDDWKMETIDYKDVERLKFFVSEHGKILSRRVTGTTTQQQRSITKSIKRARYMALLPYVGQVERNKELARRPERGNRDRNRGYDRGGRGGYRGGGYRGGRDNQGDRGSRPPRHDSRGDYRGGDNRGGDNRGGDNYRGGDNRGGDSRSAESSAPSTSASSES